jgi:hypothetical protein
MEMIDYLLEAPIAVPIIDGGAALVNVPDPARFALHKLIVAVSRPVTTQAKAMKDLHQAGELIEALIDDRPGDLELALKSANARPKGWRTKLRRGIERLPAKLEVARKKLRSGLDV